MSSTSRQKVKSRTCVLCRKRKLKCDGEIPCAHCTHSRTLVVCTYIHNPTVRTELPKGSACLSCRASKRKCDGELPCKMCETRGLECVRSAARITRKRNKPMADSDRPPSPSKTDSTQSTETSENSTNLDLVTGSPPDAPFPLSKDDHGYAEPSIFLPANDLPEYPLALLDASVPPSLARTVLDKETELYFVRNLFLDHRWQYHMNLTPSKADALSRGDISSGLIHPVLVHLAQLIGYVIANQQQSDTWVYFQGQTEGEAEQLRAVTAILYGSSESLARMPEMDAITLLQAHTAFLLYHAMKGDIDMAVRLMDTMQGIILGKSGRECLDEMGVACGAFPPATMMPSSSCCPETIAQEARSAFSAVVFIDLGRSLVLKLPMLLDEGIMDTFRRLAAANWTDNEINFIVAKSALFLVDAEQLSTEWAPNLSPTAETAWSKRYWSLLTSIDAHLKVVNTPFMEMSFTHEAQVLTLRGCILLSLAALVDLYSIFAPSHLAARRSHAGAVEEMARVSKMFGERDYQYLDAWVGTCWTIASRQTFAADSMLDQSEQYGPSRHALDTIRECNRMLGQSRPYVLQI
ncbi:hypothetical protein FB45DRAFT_230464 [Roridomyces roridus]|uniref:Zn(2)-C6 fungal-type domain-containing protein n=1 Tax=Roridomyces roridus TaxID=1738132 RepID=A0AAD7BCG5_9AGAR|nr:hypothetical protein FB45DRAFT_230464 [Roridomyces roridus]